MGLVESCIGSPNVITGFVSKHSLHGQNKYIANLGNVSSTSSLHGLCRSIYCLHGLNWHIAFMNTVICWFIANSGVTEVVCQQHELDRHTACLGIIICRFLAISGITEVVCQQHELDRHIACLGIIVCRFFCKACMG